jgi:DNA-binding CsgD family transcriptional regulator
MTSRMMNREPLHFSLAGLGTVRIVCQVAGCGAVAEVAVEEAPALFARPACRVCGAEWFGSDTGNDNPLARLASAVLGLRRHAEEIEVELAVPGQRRTPAPVSEPAARDGSAVGLSDREAEVVRLVAVGYSNKEVASRLGLSVKTVETYKTRSMRKLGAHGRVDLVRYAARCGWFRDADDGGPQGASPDPPGDGVVGKMPLVHPQHRDRPARVAQ